MHKITLIVLFLSLPAVTRAQTEKQFGLGGYIDLVKTDNVKMLRKGQVGIEGNYFMTNQFAATAGVEVWTAEGISLVLGGRWTPVEEAFVRVRGLIGENDFSIGGGWTKPINENLHFEAIGDFYFSIEFAIRVGVVYTVRR